VARAKREVLLRVHRHRLRREDLEDCYSQATLELVADARRGASYASTRELATAIERRFVSRIRDRRRALAGRSPMQAALERSLSLDVTGEHEVDVVDARAELEKLVILRLELRRVQTLIRELTPDQRLVLISQVALQTVVAGLRLDTSHDGTDVGPNRREDGPRWRILNQIPTWAHWSIRHPSGL
jgi:DNA-directed RNA polymerase specialized sigma24 family protein